MVAASTAIKSKFSILKPGMEASSTVWYWITTSWVLRRVSGHGAACSIHVQMGNALV